MIAKAKATTIATPMTVEPSAAAAKKRWREYEAQHDGESKWEKHLARNIQPGNDDGRD